jgi:hypothetical protein
MSAVKLYAVWYPYTLISYIVDRLFFTSTDSVVSFRQTVIKLANYLFSDEVKYTIAMKSILFEFSRIPGFPKETQETAVTDFIRFMNKMHMFDGTITTHLISLPFSSIDILTIHT